MSDRGETTGYGAQRGKRAERVFGERVAYINITPRQRSGLFQSRKEADLFASRDRVACIRIDLDGHDGRFDP